MPKCCLLVSGRDVQDILRVGIFALFSLFFLFTLQQKSRYTLENERLEPKNHLFEKENHLNQTSMFGFHVNFQGCTHRFMLDSGFLSIRIHPRQKKVLRHTGRF